MRIGSGQKSNVYRGFAKSIIVSRRLLGFDAVQQEFLQSENDGNNVHTALKLVPVVPGSFASKRKSSATFAANHTFNVGCEISTYSHSPQLIGLHFSCASINISLTFYLVPLYFTA